MLSVTSTDSGLKFKLWTIADISLISLSLIKRFSITEIKIVEARNQSSIVTINLQKYYYDSWESVVGYRAKDWRPTTQRHNPTPIQRRGNVNFTTTPINQSSHPSIMFNWWCEHLVNLSYENAPKIWRMVSKIETLLIIHKIHYNTIRR